MRKLIVLLIIVIFMGGIARSQDSTSDPLMGNHTLGNAAKIGLVWTRFSDSRVYQRLFRYIPLNNPDPNVLNELRPASLQADSGLSGTENDMQVDATSGDFDGNGRDDIVAAWEGPGGSVVMIVPQIDAGNLSWSQDNAFVAAPAGSLIDPDAIATTVQIRVVAGNFDDDAQKEFVLVYWGADKKIHITLYDTHGTLSPQGMATIADDSLAGSGLNTVERSSRFGIATGDLDGDGRDEIILVGSRQLSCGQSLGCWTAFVKIYAVAPGESALIPKAEKTFYTKEDNSNDYLGKIAVVAGAFGSDYARKVAVSFQVANQNGTTYYYIQPVTATSSLDTLIADPAKRTTVETRGTAEVYPMTLAAGDLDGDGRDELVFATHRLLVYRADSLLRFGNSAVAEGSLGTFTGDDGNSIMAVADLDADNDLAHDSSEWRPEIVVAALQQNNIGINTRVFKYIPGQYNLLKRADLTDTISQSTRARQLALVAGDFDGASIRVGTPRRSTRTNIISPMVILNAPPTHFDVLGGTIYNVNQCYGPTACDFDATYSTSTQQTIQTQTSVHRDWTIGATVSGGFKIPLLKVGVEASLTAKYGEGFSKVSGTSSTFTVTQSINASEDDYIYAMIVDDDIWEYPLYVGSDLEGYVAVVIPGVKTRAWFPSKSPTADAFIPLHEVGNIFSYKDVASPDENSSLAEAVRWSTADRYTVNNSSSFTWTLTSAQSTSTETQHESRFSLSSRVDFDIGVKFLPDVRLFGDYSSDNLSTYSTSVTDEKGLSVHLGSINQTFGQTYYSIQPYAYWSKSGALVIDYAVTPETDPNSPTWWQSEYGTKSDPAFILPWRLDPAKGDSLVEPEKRYQTKEIIFNPAAPNPGGTVNILARLHNFSLIPTPRQVQVRFYAGDPSNGGIPIISTSGDSVFTTTTTVADRGTAIVGLDWNVPSPIQNNLRIYAVIDPGGNIDEIHEDNNRGWTTLPILEGTSGVESDGGNALPSAFRLEQNYPNPFNPSTIIRYSVPHRSRITLVVYNMLGQAVATLVDREEEAGAHSVRFNGSNMASGAYMYVLKSEGLVSVRKLMVLK